LGPEDTSSYFTPSTTDASPTTSSGTTSVTSLPATQPTVTTASTNSPPTSAQTTFSVTQKSGADKEMGTLYRRDTADYRCLDWSGCLHIGMLVANPFSVRWIQEMLD